jgi:hypothetical protein
MLDNTTFHLWRNMTQWIEKNLGNAETAVRSQGATESKKGF